MHGDPLDILLRSLLAAPSRRHLLRLLAGSALGGLLSFGTPPSQAKRRGKGKGKSKGKGTVTFCHAGQTLRVSTKGKHEHLHHGDTLGACPSSPPPPPVPVLNYQCPGPYDANFWAGSNPATTRFAQTFTAAQSGSLHLIQVEVYKTDEPSTGDYLVELLAATGGVPTNTVLAAVTIPDASVPNDVSTQTVSFSGPLLTAGTEYAVAISRPGGSQLAAMGKIGNLCTGQTFHQDPSGGSGPFYEFSSDLDMLTSVTVLA